jgi:hypothetical protein
LIVENTSNTTHGISQTFSIVSGNAYTGSVYLKTASRTWAYLQFDGNLWAESGSRPRVWVNLSTGQLGSSDRNSGVSIANVGNGWYRVTLTATANTSATSSFNIALTTADANFSSYTGDGTSGIYLWGAQLEQSSTVGEYIPTTSTINSAPRFDHNPTTRESLGLLVEEQRTNLLLRSEEFDNAAWGKFQASVTNNETTSPDGVISADALIEDTLAGEHRTSTTSTASLNTSLTVSLYVKTRPGGVARSIRLLLANNASTGNSISCVFTNALNVFTAATPVNSGTASNAAATVLDVGNGWYRITLSGIPDTGTGAGTALLRINLHTGSTASYTGDGISGLYLWGAQLEAGAFPTSYIPTTTATVTRSADVASITGSNFSSWYRQDEGSLYAAYLTPYVAPASAGQAVFSLNDGTADNRNVLSKRANVDTSTRWLSTKTGAIDTAFINVGTWTANSLQTAAVVYKENDYAGSLSGATVVTDTSVNLATNLNRIEVGVSTSGSYLNGTIRRLTYWPQRLANEVLQRITQ